MWLAEVTECTIPPHPVNDKSAELSANQRSVHAVIGASAPTPRPRQGAEPRAAKLLNSRRYRTRTQRRVRRLSIMQPHRVIPQDVVIGLNVYEQYRNALPCANIPPATRPGGFLHERNALRHLLGIQLRRRLVLLVLLVRVAAHAHHRPTHHVPALRIPRQYSG